MDSAEFRKQCKGIYTSPAWRDLSEVVSALYWEAAEELTKVNLTDTSRGAQLQGYCQALEKLKKDIERYGDMPDGEPPKPAF